MFKKSVVLLLCLLILTAPLVSVTSFAYGGILGDVNNDGTINTYDYLLLKRAYFKTYDFTYDEEARADVDCDGEITSYDYVLLKRHYFGTYTIQQPDNGEEKPSSAQIPNVVSAGKQYTVNTEAGTSYPDSYNCELTDGVYNVSSSYVSGSFSGYHSDFSIVTDLEDEGIDLNRFDLSYLSINDAGIDIPACITVYGSSDTNKWTNLGNMDIPDYAEGKVMVASLKLDNEVSYRYIRFDVKRLSYWVFVDELLIYSSIIKYSEDGFYEISKLYSATAPTEDEMKKNLESVSSNVVFDPSLGSNVVSYKCDYTVKCDGYDWRTEENGTTLTDGGIVGASFEHEVWLGIDTSRQSEITIDLGEARSDIYAFALHCFNRTGANINLPYFVEISVSMDGYKYTAVGRSYAPLSSQENYSYRVALKELVNARYVRFVIPKGSGYCWIEEAEVYSNAAGDNTPQMLYGDFAFETTAVPSYWEKGSDYTAVQNLILNLPQQIESDDYLEYDSYYESNTPEASNLLTDGEVTDDTYCYNGKWFHMYAGGARSIFYDLGYISSVSSFSVRILDYKDWAIVIPDTIKLILSENGEDWYVAGELAPQSTSDKILLSSKTLDSAYRARYAMIYMDITSHVFIDEITVNGTKEISNAKSLTLLPTYNIRETDSDYGYAAPSPELLGGVEDVCLIYHNAVHTDEAFFRPYVGYVDENGNVTDTMFDGYLFLPSTGSLPSGGRPYETNYASDWNYLFDELFTEGINFDALDKTAESTINELGLNDYKLKVYVTIPHMDDTLYDFGDIDFDGNNDSLTTLENRVYVAKYYAERVIKEFNSRNYKNIELCGFYWFHEAISGGDVETAKSVNTMFDELGYGLFWIPYYNASGYSRWEEFGFDVGCYQPNYAFHLTVDETRLAYASESAKRYGMCIEIEIDAASFSDIRFFKKYMNYLKYGLEYGYMNEAIHMYYQGTDDFGISSRSDNERLRLIYEYTYQFIKGTLDITPDKPENMYFNAEINTLLKEKLSSSEDPTTIYRLSSSPEHGSVTVSENGEFVYYPNKGYTGTDTFTYQISHYLGWSEEVTVTVEIG